MDDLISRKSLLEKTHMADVLHAIKGITKSVEVVLVDDVEVAPSVFDGKTNGEVVETVWGYSIGTNNDVLTVQTDINAVLVIIDIEGMRRELRFNLDWWNAPYKGDSE